MRIIDRYIAKSIIVTFFWLIFIFCFLYILIDAASNLDELIKQRVELPTLARYYASFLPIIITQTASIACLISTLLSYGQLQQNNEIIALRAAGLNFWRIAKPALFWTAFVAALIFFLNERFVPQAAAVSNQIKNEKMISEIDRKDKRKEKIQNLTFYGLKNRLYFIDIFDPNNFSIDGITLIGHDNNQNVKEKIVALKGKWSGIMWKFYNCQVTTFDPSHPELPGELKYYDEKLMDIKETPQDFIRQRVDVESMNTQELYNYIQRFAESGATKAINNLRVDFHQKIAFAFGAIAIVLVGLPISLMGTRRRAVTFMSLGIAVATGFLFYVINAVGLALGKGSVLSPMASAWLAPGLFFLIGLYLIKTKF